MKIDAVCAYCTVIFKVEAGAANRARKVGLNLYCGKICSGYGRRLVLSVEERKAEKAEYDQAYRKKNRQLLRDKKADYRRKTYDPVKAAAHRKTRMPYHVEYCRRPEYRKKKSAYDREYCAKKEYGPFWESHLLSLDIRREALAQMSDIEIRNAKGTLNKRQQRRRDYEATVRSKSEIGSLGNLERGQRG